MVKLCDSFLSGNLIMSDLGKIRLFLLLHKLEMFKKRLKDQQNFVELFFYLKLHIGFIKKIFRKDA